MIFIYTSTPPPGVEKAAAERKYGGSTPHREVVASSLQGLVEALA